eukprot:43546-Eustigmatos_ZCMA.PRE.1
MMPRLQTRSLRQQLNEERKISAQLRASLVGSQLKRSELEGFFLQAVELHSGMTHIVRNDPCDHRT